MDVTKHADSGSSSPAPKPGQAPHAVPRPRRLRLPMKIADAYLLTSVCEATLRGLIWFAGLLFAFSVITAVRRVVADQLPLIVMMELVAYQMPRVFLFTLPISVLYGTVQTFTDMSTRGELTALGAGGMSLPRMVRAPMLWGVILALCALLLQESIVPKAQRQYQDVIVKRALENSGTQKDFVLTDMGKDGRGARTIFADVFEPKTRTLLNPRITIYNEDKQVGIEVIAERAQWDITAGKWRFYKGRSRFTPRIGTSNVPFSEQQYTGWTNFEEGHVDYMPDPKLLNETGRSIQYHLDKKNFEMLSISDLRAYLDKHEKWIEAAPTEKDKEFILERQKALTFGIHDKIATPLICFAVVLIGAPLGVRPQRSASAGIAMGLSLGALLVYYVVWTWASQLGKGGLGNPYVLAYFPLALTLVIAAVLMKIKSR